MITRPSGAAIAEIIIVIIGLLTLNSSLFTVNETNQVVVTQLGKPIKVLKSPGLYMKIPFIQTANKFEDRLLEYDAAPRRCVTKDKKYIFLNNYARWRIVDPLLFMKTVRNEPGAHSRLDDIIYSVLREEVGKYNLMDTVRTSNRKILSAEITPEEEEIKREIERIEVGREKIMKVVNEKSDQMARQYGIKVIDVRIKRADLPKANREAVFARMKAERNRISNRYLSEGEGEKAKILGEMERKLAGIRSEAYRKAQEIKGRADAEATKIYAGAYEQDPDFFNFSKTLETYRETLSKKTLIVVPLDSKFFKYLAPEAAPEKASSKKPFEIVYNYLKKRVKAPAGRKRWEKLDARS